MCFMHHNSRISYVCLFCFVLFCVVLFCVFCYTRWDTIYVCFSPLRYRTQFLSLGRMAGCGCNLEGRKTHFQLHDSQKKQQPHVVKTKTNKHDCNEVLPIYFLYLSCFGCVITLFWLELTHVFAKQNVRKGTMVSRYLLNPFPGAWGSDPIRYDLWTPPKRHGGKIMKVLGFQKDGVVIRS